MAEDLTSYECWDLTFPSISERSRLYHVVPIGIGTPSVESLISYAIRLSDCHGISLGSLIGTQLIPSIQQHSLENPSSVLPIK